MGPKGRLSLADQLRWLTIQFSLEPTYRPALVRAALELQLRLLEPETMFSGVLKEMIAEQQPRPDFREVENERQRNDLG